MKTTLQRLGRALAAGSAALTLAACGGETSVPSAPAPEAAIEAAAAAPVSVTIRGSVVDPSNRQMKNAAIECLGDVQCTGPNADLIQEGHGHRITTTDANGLYHIVATSRSGGAGFLMNANARGFEVQWREVAWPDAACSADQPRCALTVDFKLRPMAELDE
jgi:ABC-type phosphate transport system substrate-binding protein